MLVEITVDCVSVQAIPRASQPTMSPLVKRFSLTQNNIQKQYVVLFILNNVNISLYFYIH